MPGGINSRKCFLIKGRVYDYWDMVIDADNGISTHTIFSEILYLSMHPSECIGGLEVTHRILTGV